MAAGTHVAGIGNVAMWQVETLKISLLLNQCLMMQKLEEWGESIAPCNLVPSLCTRMERSSKLIGPCRCSKTGQRMRKRCIDGEFLRRTSVYLMKPRLLY